MFVKSTKLLSVLFVILSLRRVLTRNLFVAYVHLGCALLPSKSHNRLLPDSQTNIMSQKCGPAGRTHWLRVPFGTGYISLVMQKQICQITVKLFLQCKLLNFTLLFIPCHLVYSYKVYSLKQCHCRTKCEHDKEIHEAKK